MKTLFLLCATAALLCGCGNRQEAAADDFGAAQTARFAVEAERVCAAAGFEDLPSCAEAPTLEARRSAKAALAMEATYTKLCAADLRRDRCDDMLMSAYFVAKK